MCVSCLVDILRRWPYFRVQLHHRAHQILQILRIIIINIDKMAFCYFFIHLVQILTEKRSLKTHQLIYHTSKRPYIRLDIIRLSLPYLRTDIRKRPCSRIIHIIANFTDVEICYFITFRCKYKYITWLNVNIFCTLISRCIIFLECR